MPIFQPTLPARGATLALDILQRRAFISTHAPRTGSDSWLRCSHTTGGDFNPRSPHGERHFARACDCSRAEYFNPRSPHGERPGFPGGKKE